MKHLLKFVIVFSVIFCIYVLNSYMPRQSKLAAGPEKINHLNLKKPGGVNHTALDLDKIAAFYESVSSREKKIFSQNKEDGVILALLDFLKIKKPGYYVEFGTENAAQCNTRNLRENYNWTGLLMDGSNENQAINLYKETILHSNIIELFEKHKVPIEFEIFSEDTDYADYWIVEKVLTVYKPKIVIHEVNQQLPDRCVTVPKPSKLIFWSYRSAFHGGSVCAFHCLAKQFNYTMVYCEKAGVNCFWIRNDLLLDNLNVDIAKVQSFLNPQYLFKNPIFTYLVTNDEWFQVKC